MYITIIIIILIISFKEFCRIAFCCCLNRCNSCLCQFHLTFASLNLNLIHTTDTNTDTNTDSNANTHTNANTDIFVYLRMIYFWFFAFQIPPLPPLNFQNFYNFKNWITLWPNVCNRSNQIVSFATMQCNLGFNRPSSNQEKPIDSTWQSPWCRFERRGWKQIWGFSQNGKKFCCRKCTTFG